MCRVGRKSSTRLLESSLNRFSASVAPQHPAQLTPRGAGRDRLVASLGCPGDLPGLPINKRYTSRRPGSGSDFALLNPGRFDRL